MYAFCRNNAVNKWDELGLYYPGSEHQLPYIHSAGLSQMARDARIRLYDDNIMNFTIFVRAGDIWSSSDKTELANSISAVNKRIAKLFDEIDKEIDVIKCKHPGQKGEELIKRITKLKKNLKITYDNLNSNDYELLVLREHLEIRNDPDKIPFAKFRQNKWWDWRSSCDILYIYTDSISYPDFRVSLFHELTHMWSNDLKDDPYMDAHQIDDLFETPFQFWPTYTHDYSQMFREIRNPPKK